MDRLGRDHGELDFVGFLLPRLIEWIEFMRVAFLFSVDDLVCNNVGKKAP